MSKDYTTVKMILRRVDEMDKFQLLTVQQRFNQLNAKMNKEKIRTTFI